MTKKKNHISWLVRDQLKKVFNYCSINVSTWFLWCTFSCSLFPWDFRFQQHEIYFWLLFNKCLYSSKLEDNKMPYRQSHIVPLVIIESNKWNYQFVILQGNFCKEPWKDRFSWLLGHIEKINARNCRIFEVWSVEPCTKYRPQILQIAEKI